MGTLFADSAHLDRYIAEQFFARQVEFYHAENIAGFKAHCKAGNLLCRKHLLEADPDHYVPLDSDEYDRSTGYDERVRGNIYDLGRIFERAHEDNGPYIAGPFVFVFKREVFAQMRDIVILPESMWTAGRHWAQKRVATEAQVDQLLSPGMPEDQVHRNWQYGELSCSNNSIPLSYLSKVMVEPLTVVHKGKSYGFARIAEDVLARHSLSRVPVEVRPYRSGKRGGIRALEVMTEFCRGLPSTVTLQSWNVTPDDLPESLRHLSTETKNRLIQWAKYYTFGTVRYTR